MGINKLKKIVLDNAKVYVNDIDEYTDIIDDLGYDSIGVVQLLIEIEEKLGVEINDIYGLEKYGKLERFVESNIDFERYYMKFLGITSKSETFKGIILEVSELRDSPINKKYFYPCIISNYKNVWYISYSKRVEDELKRKIKKLKINNYNEILNSITIRNTYSDCFVRMIWDKKVIRSTDKKIQWNLFYSESLKKFCAKKEGKTVGYCKISDIFDGYGNIVIFIEEKERNKGLATILLNKILDKCNELEINPIYFTRKNNIASVRLAEKVGFRMVCEEIIYTEEKEKI